MKVYVDLLLFLNFAFDFILLQTVSIILKRKVPLRRLFLGALIGSLTIFTLFAPFTTLSLFILKVFLSFIIIISTFGFKDMKYTLTNLFYFYIVSIILGGVIYYLNVEFSYKNIGMVFYHKGLSINYIFILIASPVSLIIYRNQTKKLRLINSLHYNIDVYLNGKIIKLHSYLDTGNTLVDPISKKPIIITNSKKLINYIRDNPYYLVPYESVNTKGFIKCIKVDKVYIDKVGLITNVRIGITSKKLKNGVDALLNNLIMEERNENIWFYQKVI